MEKLYFNSHKIGRIRGWVLEFFQFQIIPRYIESIETSNVEKLYFDSHEIGGIGEILERSNSNISLQELYFDSRIIRES